MSIMPPNPTSYVGQVATPFILRTFPPTTSFNNFPVPTLWIDTNASEAYVLVSVALGVAQWVPIGGTSLEIDTLTGNSGGPVGPDSINHNVNLLGSGSVTVVGTPLSNTLTISVSGGAVTWQRVSANQALVADNGYICVAPGGALSFSLPATSVLGQIIEITLDGATSFTITQTAGQQIKFGDIATTVGVGGSITSTQQGDTIRMVCQTANLTWNVLSSMGNPIVV